MKQVQGNLYTQDGKLYRLCKVAIIPTTEPSLLYTEPERGGMIYFNLSNTKAETSNLQKPQHLYIYSDQTIVNKGEVKAICLDEADDNPQDALVENVGNCQGCREIVGTTNHKVNTNKIPEQFIIDYCNNQGEGFDEIMVECYNWDDCPSSQRDSMSESEWGSKYVGQVKVKNGFITIK